MKKYKYMTGEARKELDQKLDILKFIRKKCGNENRSLTDSENKESKKLLAEIEELGRLSSGPPDITPVGNNGGRNKANRVGYEARSHAQEKRFSDLYGTGRNEYEWRDPEANFYQALFSGRFHPELTKRAMSEGVPSDGGFLVPIQYSKDIHNVALESEIILPRAQVQPMTSNEIKLPAMEIGDHSANLFGGFTATWKPELGTLTQANPKARMMTLQTNKLTGFVRASNELISDMNGPEKLTEITGKGLGFYRDAAFISGSGAGQPQGLLNASCKIEVSKETGQSADTIILENLNSMLSRLYMGGFKNSVWIVSQTALPQLLTLSLAVGTGGSASLVMTEQNGEYKIFGRPVIFSEHMEEVGTAGDIILTDLSQYVVGLKEELRIDLSGHVFFETDELAMRLISRLDGQSLWDEPLTLKGSGTTVSPIITLAERA
jgi:HK97 family phage major capsid protein